MKAIHTSDWHLGQEFYTFDRTSEHESFLDQLRTIVLQERPDVMAVSGDIYHTSTPSNSVMRFFVDKLDAIRQACPEMLIVVTAGNHDSSSRLEVMRPLWAHLGVCVVGRIEKTDGKVDFDRHIIPVPASDGGVKGYVVALPHVFPQSFPILEEGTPRELRQKAFIEALSGRLQEINPDGLPVIMMAHMAVTGSDITGHDESRGGMEFIDASEIALPYDYLALGHIHCPQTLPSGKERYSGSPVPVSFDEDYQHSVTLVEVEKGQKPKIETVDVINVAPLLTIPSEPARFDDVLSSLEQTEIPANAYVRLNALLEDVPPANAMLRAAAALEGKGARFCTIRWTREHAPAVHTTCRIADVDEIRSMTPLELAETYYMEKYEAQMPDEVKELFNEAVNAVLMREE